MFCYNSRMIKFGSWMLAELKETSTFKTHLNYIKCVDLLFANSSIGINITTTGKLANPRMDSFVKLARFTKSSIKNDLSFIDQDNEYAQVVAPWIPVKCYYQLYYLESMFLFLLDGNVSGFSASGGHSKVREGMKRAIKDGKMRFSTDKLNELYIARDALAFKASSGNNVQKDYYKTDNCIGSVVKKITSYKEKDWKERNKIDNFRTKVNKDRRNIFLDKEVVLQDFFYWMRIKANYKDVDFLDFDNINPSDAAHYIRSYVSATDSYARALTTAILQMKKSRDA